jgi:hypothetical protein
MIADAVAIRVDEPFSVTSPALTSSLAGMIADAVGVLIDKTAMMATGTPDIIGGRIKAGWLLRHAAGRCVQIRGIGPIALNGQLPGADAGW